MCPLSLADPRPALYYSKRPSLERKLLISQWAREKERERFAMSDKFVLFPSLLTFLPLLFSSHFPGMRECVCGSAACLLGWLCCKMSSLALVCSGWVFLEKRKKKEKKRERRQGSGGGSGSGCPPLRGIKRYRERERGKKSEMEFSLGICKYHLY